MDSFYCYIFPFHSHWWPYRPPYPVPDTFIENLGTVKRGAAGQKHLNSKQKWEKTPRLKSTFPCQKYLARRRLRLRSWGFSLLGKPQEFVRLLNLRVVDHILFSTVDALIEGRFWPSETKDSQPQLWHFFPFGFFPALRASWLFRPPAQMILTVVDIIYSVVVAVWDGDDAQGHYGHYFCLYKCISMIGYF